MDDQNFKRSGDVKKREEQISRKESFFLFYQSKIVSNFVPVIPVSPDTTLQDA